MLASLIRILLPFFSWPYLLLFVEMQKLTGLLISGSAALYFFNDQFYCLSDLDLYVDFDRRDAVIEFLLKAGYQYKPRPNQDPKLENTALLHSSQLAIFTMHTTTVTFVVQSDYSGKTIMAVLNFQRLGHENVIQVILTHGTPV
ncbi:hypothetical protein ARMGADRAFT_927447 [Armillaria gallica]|uniref:Nucleotidyltransferase family protein n=1 Tax=Armillaria gallica TaxID=47427 RepID=A0A2H3DK61_ARMGA|nr:hypothetical protein ARMGADRAFT_927447 [Armillaria gallica]